MAMAMGSVGVTVRLRIGGRVGDGSGMGVLGSGGLGLFWAVSPGLWLGQRVSRRWDTVRVDG